MQYHSPLSGLITRDNLAAFNNGRDATGYWDRVGLARKILQNSQTAADQQLGKTQFDLGVNADGSMNDNSIGQLQGIERGAANSAADRGFGMSGRMHEIVAQPGRTAVAYQAADADAAAKDQHKAAYDAYFNTRSGADRDAAQYAASADPSAIDPRAIERAKQRLRKQGL